MQNATIRADLPFQFFSIIYSMSVGSSTNGDVWMDITSEDRQLVTEIVIEEVDQNSTDQKIPPMKPNPLTEINQTIEQKDDVPMELDEFEISTREAETERVLEQHGCNIMRNYFKNERKHKDLLSKHQIEHKERRRLVNWIKEVCATCRCDERTFFLAIAMIDQYFIICSGVEVLKRVHLHIIGVTALFMASKYEGTFTKLNQKSNDFFRPATSYTWYDLQEHFP